MRRLLLLRGAPGAGKSTTARELVRRLGGPPEAAAVEVDELRGDLCSTPALRLDDAERHHVALVHAARLARSLLGAGVRRVVVVDTFAPAGVLAFRTALHVDVEVQTIVLHAPPDEHARRVASRQGEHAFRDVGAALAMAAGLDAEGCAVSAAGEPHEVAARVAATADW